MPGSSPRRFLAALAFASVACAGDAPAPRTPEPELPLVDRIVLVSVDGLRGDALDHMPLLRTLLERAAWSDSVQTVVPSLTVPGHLALFTGRDVTQMGIVDNAFDERAAATLVINGASSFFRWTRSAGGRSIALAGLGLVPAEDIEATREFFEIDSLIPVDREVEPIVERAIGIATRSGAPELLFVHVPTVDFAGHDGGWISPDAAGAEPVLTSAYLDAVRRVDIELDRLWRALAPELDAGRVALVITADHGGGRGEGCVEGVPAAQEHCTAHQDDVIIPVVVIARSVAPGRLASTHRITQVAPTIAALLGFAAPAAIDAALPLTILSEPR